MLDSDGRKGMRSDSDYVDSVDGPTQVTPNMTETKSEWSWGTHEALALTVTVSLPEAGVASAASSASAAASAAANNPGTTDAKWEIMRSAAAG